MSKSGTEAYVSSLPTCDIHRFVRKAGDVPAAYDGKTIEGPWANMCQECFDVYGVGLGTGRGQRLVVGTRPKPTITPGMSADDIWDAVGDGDIADYL